MPHLHEYNNLLEPHEQVDIGTNKGLAQTYASTQLPTNIALLSQCPRLPILGHPQGYGPSSASWFTKVGQKSGHYGHDTCSLATGLVRGLLDTRSDEDKEFLMI